MHLQRGLTSSPETRTFRHNQPLDRLALLGEMTASMAHRESTQPISGIIMNADTPAIHCSAPTRFATTFLLKRARAELENSRNVDRL